MQKLRTLLVSVLIMIAVLLSSQTVAWASIASDKAQSTDKSVKTIEKHEKAQVLKIVDLNQEELGEAGGMFKEQLVTVKILSGTHKGKTVESLNTLSGSQGIDINVKKGDKVIVYLTEENGQIAEVYIADLMRANYLNYLIFAFVVLLIIIGGRKGIKALIALAFTVLAIYKVLLPAIVKGYSPLPLTVGILIVVTIFTMIIVAGFTRKSMAAALGTAGGVLIAGLLAYWVGDLAHLFGLATEESRMLLFVDGLKIDMKGLLFSGIIIGALGAIMDVAMSVASAVDEVEKANPSLPRWRLMSAGMNVGRDIMGTMANTLILAYTGGALPLLLLFIVYNTSTVSIYNSELIATEIVRAIVGSIGLIFSVPLTAFIAGVFAREDKKMDEFNYSGEL